MLLKKNHIMIKNKQKLLSHCINAILYIIHIILYYIIFCSACKGSHSIIFQKAKSSCFIGETKKILIKIIQW